MPGTGSWKTESPYDLRPTMAAAYSSHVNEQLTIVAESIMVPTVHGKASDVTPDLANAATATTTAQTPEDTVQAETPATKDTPTDADTYPPKPEWQQSAPIWCTKNGRSHIALIDFGYNECPLCSQDLTDKRLKVPGAPQDGDELTDGAQDDQHTKISHSIEYVDSGENRIATQPWSGPFDLQTARKGITEKEPSVFNIVTLLKTSHISEKRRYEFEVKDILRTGILNNPNISVNILSTRITINSQALIKVLGDHVDYYPGISFGGKVLELEEPYAVVAHHIAELEEYRASYHPGDEEGAGKEVAGAVAEKHCDKETFDHLGLMLDFVKNSVWKDKILQEQDRHARNSCTFQMLWFLFKPGDTVYVENRGKLSAFVVQEVGTDKAILSDTKHIYKSYRIVLWSLRYDGRFVGRSSTEMIIPHFDGERLITSLKVFPAKFYDNIHGMEMRTALERNGKRWYELLRGQQVHYQGEFFEKRKEGGDAQAHQDEEDNDDDRPWYETMVQYLKGASRRDVIDAPRNSGPFDGRAYVDPASFYSLFPRFAPKICDTNDTGEDLALCGCTDCHGRRAHPPRDFPWACYDLLDPMLDKDLTLQASTHGPNHRYLLCDSLLYGFILKTRSWQGLDVAYCREPRVHADAIDKLVMAASRKDMIKALVQKFTGADSLLAKSWRADYIENKGEGQIFLLHGGPGVGKTYVSLWFSRRNLPTLAAQDLNCTDEQRKQTAECIAEYTNRPLLSLTCGDIGTDEVRMEEELSKWFRLAEKWGAVMLIDEADVYLERRMASDLRRNSLVSVFLRCIEYYRGILFLTTNRIGYFDDAFISRIHIVIKYDALNEDDRRQIWTQFFEKLADEREDFNIKSRAKSYVLEDDSIRKLEWNGREIRNAFQTAVALAEFRFLQKANKSKDEGPTLDQRDFEQVCEMTRQFKEYLQDLHGLDEESRAYNARARAGNQDWGRHIRK
ncbi:hypothetical protein B0T21DRAFT_454345 [Apiosordaria backusii]|uniref:AAA+ ATPase domain-containing protein n=1 Tax=Apiosordaria backusii TaxID=314023 RepID=A0AA40DWV5_9PEZI|nr:hypothetical protein B0T21DRAFT_454345 [Apiosordaria backusii]